MMKSYLKCHTDGFMRFRRSNEEDKIGEQLHNWIVLVEEYLHNESN